MSMNRFLCLIALLCLACGTVRSALVPLAIEPPIPQARGRAEVQVRATALTGVDGGGSVRLSRYFALRFNAGSAIDAGALRAGGSAEAPRLAGWYGTVSPSLLYPLDHGRTQLGLSVDVSAAAVPYVWEESYECTSAPDGFCTSTSQEMWVAFLLGTSLSVARWVGDVVRLAASIGARVQPTLDSAFADENRAPTGLGYLAVAMQVEARFQIAREFALAVNSQWVAPVGPFWVYPTVGLTLSGTIDGDSPGEDPLDASTWVDVSDDAS
jgi:hypothetical protein